MKSYMFKHKGWLSLSFFTIILASAVEIFKAYVLQQVIDSTTDMNGNRLKSLVILVTVFILGTVLIMIVESLCTNRFIQKCMFSIKNKLYGRITEKNIQKFNENNTSDYISALTNDMNTIESDYFQNLISVLEYIVIFLFAFIAIFHIHYYFILFIGITAWIPLIINGLMSNSITKRKIEFSDQISSFTGKIKDIFMGFETIKTFNINPVMKENFKTANKELEEKRFQSKFINDTCERLSFGGSLIIWLGSLLLGYVLVLQGKLTVGYVLGASQLLNNISNPLYRLSFLINKMNSSKVLLKKRMEQTKERNFTEETVSKKDFQDKIEFRNAGLKIGGKEILKEIHLTFEKGKKYAIVGDSGSGKSSLIKLLMGYYEDYSGSILIDGIELSRIEEEEWYNVVTMVAQNVYLFNESIKSNITLFHDYKPEEIDEAIRASHSSQFINALPETIDTYVNESGKNFSGGECQRISIARALIRKTPVILLDEATSALDRTTAIDIEKSILGLEGVTVIAVTHKIHEETRNLYDNVITVSAGTSH